MRFSRLSQTFLTFYAQHEPYAEKDSMRLFISAENPRTQRKKALSSLSQNWHTAEQSDKLLALETLAKLCEAGELELRILALRTLACICRQDTYMRQQVLLPNTYVIHVHTSLQSENISPQVHNGNTVSRFVVNGNPIVLIREIKKLRDIVMCSSEETLTWPQHKPPQSKPNRTLETTSSLRNTRQVPSPPAVTVKSTSRGDTQKLRIIRDKAQQSPRSPSSAHAPLLIKRRRTSATQPNASKLQRTGNASSESPGTGNKTSNTKKRATRR